MPTSSALEVSPAAVGCRGRAGPTWSIWLGAYPTWETIAGQLASLAFVIGSYHLARELQINQPRRQAQARQAQEPDAYCRPLAPNRATPTA